jgi:HEAT repeat protein
MTPSVTENAPPPSSYADFSDAEGGGWAKTALQFFAIPLLIVLVAVGIYVGVRLMVGTGPQTAGDFVNLLQSDTINRRWQAAFELSARLGSGPVPDEFRDPRLVSALCAALEPARREAAEDPRLAVHLLLILRRLADPAALGAVRDAAADPNPVIRSHAVRVLPALGDRESIPRLLELTKDGDHGTRQAALAALVELDQVEGLGFHLSEATRTRAREMLGDRHEDVRFQAAYELAKAGDAAALPVLRRMLDRAHLKTFEFDRSATGLSRYKIHSNLILRALDAARALDARDPELIEAISKLARDDGDADVREQARTVLKAWEVPD